MAVSASDCSPGKSLTESGAMMPSVGIGVKRKVRRRTKTGTMGLREGAVSYSWPAPLSMARLICFWVRTTGK